MKDVYYAVAHREQAQIDTFKTRYQDFDENIIPEVFNKALGIKVESWKPSDSWGSSHVIYVVQVKGQEKPLILRANTGWGEPEVVMLTEKLVTDKVLELGLLTNKVLYVDVSRKYFSFDYQIQEDVGGLDPEVNFPDSQTEYDQLSFDLGVYIAKLQEFTLPGFGRFDERLVLESKLVGSKKAMFDYIWVCLEEDLDYLTKNQVINNKQDKAILKIFAGAEKELNIAKGSLIHHDLADHNLRYENGHLLAVFDWEAMVVGDPILDLASCPTWKTLYPREEKLISGYRSIRDLPDNFETKRDIYCLRTMLWKIRYVLRMGIMNGDRQKKFDESLEPFGI